MVGSGTTPKMAKMNNRKYIGFDINQEYIDIVNQRLNLVIPYTIENPNPKLKFIVSREETLLKRKKKTISN
jgi:site-specific DNA-methyltransferase (adenine-specific)